MITGKVALVTGGSRGIGLAIARALAASGADAVVTGRDERALADAAGRAAGDGGRIQGVRADVRNPDEAAHAVAETERRFGGLDILVNNAGVGKFARVEEMAVEDWRAVIDTNLSGVFHCCRAALPLLKRRGGGWIINISSLASVNPFANGAAYSASKAGLNAFTEALMQEVRYDGIRVSSILPGSVDTGFGGGRSSGQADWKLAPDDIARAVVELVNFPARSLPSRIEMRPSQPPRK